MIHLLMIVVILLDSLKQKYTKLLVAVGLILKICMIMYGIEVYNRDNGFHFMEALLTGLWRSGSMAVVSCFGTSSFLWPFYCPCFV
jgi:hypothetical protein